MFLDGVQRCECGIGGGVDKDAIIAEAQQRGITLTEADFVADTSVELSEDELDEVAGGGKCAGVMGGGTRAVAATSALQLAAAAFSMANAMQVRHKRRRGQVILLRRI